MSKTIIIGGSFAGLSCALQAKQLYPDMEVQVFDSQETVGFIPSGMNLVLNHEVDQLEAASFISEKEVRAAGVQLYLGHQVVEVDMKAKWLRAKNLKTQVITDYPYDQLVLAMGSKQTGHLVAHLDHPAIISTKDLGSAHHALEVLEDAGHVVVVGGGQIGIEACEALVNANKQVTLIEANDSLAERYFDADFVEEIEAAIEIVGVDLRVGQKVTAVETEPLRVILEDGDEIYADAILMGVNLFPNSSLVADQVELNPDKTIWTSPYLETSVTDVFAVGDLVQVPYADQGRDFIALVNNAIRSGQIAAFNLKENRVKQATSLRVIGSRIFSQYVVSVAKTEHEANGTSAQPVQTITVRADYSLTDSTPVYLKLITEAETGRILGAKMRSESNILTYADTLALAIGQGLTDQELAFQDRLYYPLETVANPIIYRAALESYAQRVAK